MAGHRRSLAVLTELSGAWMGRVHEHRSPDGIILDMDSSESPTSRQRHKLLSSIINTE